jgi:hypothetical protein
MTLRYSERFDASKIDAILDAKFGKKGEDNLTVLQLDAKKATREYILKWFKDWSKRVEGDNGITVWQIEDMADGFYSGYVAGSTSGVNFI